MENKRTLNFYAMFGSQKFEKKCDKKKINKKNNRKNVKENNNILKLKNIIIYMVFKTYFTYYFYKIK